MESQTGLQGVHQAKIKHSTAGQKAFACKSQANPFSAGNDQSGMVSRQVLAIETDTSLPAARLIMVLEQLKESRGLPKMIRMDNGPEFISQKLDN